MRRSPRDTAESVRRITRRGLILAGLQAGAGVALAARMRQLQVEDADRFRLLAEQNRVNIRLLAPPRGLIYDRDGGLLAGNEPVYRVVLVREDAGDVAAVLERLSRLVPLTEADIARVIDEATRRPAFVPITVADRLSWEDLAEVAVNAPALPGVTPEVGLSRHYPQDIDLAHVVGYVGPVSEADLAAQPVPDPLLSIPGFQVGKVGVEARLEPVLRGRAGSKQVEVNAVGRVMRELGRSEGQPGATVQLTLDRRLQNFVQARLGEESASVVVMDVASGDILAMNSSPSYDPNLFVRGISVPDYGALTNNDHRPLANKAVQDAYPPGSTYKMVTALAALEDGIIDADDTIWCPGYLEASGRRFHCWRSGGHGHLNLVHALEQSCDVFFYELSLRVGIDRINAMARRLGFGQRFELPVSAISEGLNPSREWKRARRGAEWLIGDTINASIGQGFVLASPLQLAVMSARIASGRAVVPRLVRSVDGEELTAPEAPALGLSSGWLDLVRAGMSEVCNSRRGTAYSSRIDEAAWRMAGKTGTSQVRNISVAERAAGVTSNDDLPWNRRDHALFVAFAPVEAPRLAVSVVVEHGGGGSTAAAPIARDVVLFALNGGLPPLSAYPQSQRARIDSLLGGLELRDFGGDGRPGRVRA